MKIPVIAGPCSLESESQIDSVAASMAAAGVDALRAGIWKPRTRPGCFEGMGEKGLPWLVRAARSRSMKCGTEVACGQHVEACLKAGLDFVWIGARTTANPFSVQEIADTLKGSDVTVLVKNPLNPDPEVWAGAIERIRLSGVKNTVAVHRGFSTLSEQKYRNEPLWSIAVQMRTRFPDMKLFCDPSHIAGNSALVEEVAQTALNMGFDGLMVEVHPCPSEALSDAAQQLSPDAFASMLAGLSVRSGNADASALEAYRQEIDSLDASLLRSLARRMELCREIGGVKKKSNSTILQADRWREVLEKAYAYADANGLDRAFVLDIFNRIHSESISQQNCIIQDENKV